MYENLIKEVKPCQGSMLPLVTHAYWFHAGHFHLAANGIHHPTVSIYMFIRRGLLVNKDTGFEIASHIMHVTTAHRQPRSKAVVGMTTTF